MDATRVDRQREAPVGGDEVRVNRVRVDGVTVEAVTVD